ncbi:MAG: molybdopterin-dependent oxidoreductase, partial [Gammaproteobacteria bacterium]|nr:molybdopterin-dependent oxidoreductase [Gammaproteobacteria bacterium]
MDNQTIQNVGRRNFLKATGLTGGAFILGATLPMGCSVEETGAAQHEINFFVSIAKDGQVTIVNHRSEMGQGIKTSVPQIIADELEADWDLVSVIQAKGDAKYGPQSTGGSASIRTYFTYIRQMGATARDMLEQAAANIWKVDKSQVKAQGHAVLNLANGQTIGYGDLAIHAANLPVPEKDSVKLKDIKDFNLIGKDVKLVDLDTMVAGKMQYAHDIQLPDMLIASIERPPVVGGKVKSFDATEAKKVKGVVDVIRLKDRGLPSNLLPLSGVAVLATNTWAALQGRKKLKIEWDHGTLIDEGSNDYQQKLKEKVNTKGITVRNEGDIDNHQYNPDKTVEATYSVPYIHHASMETPAATAHVKGDTCTVWTGTQSPQRVQSQAAEEIGLSKEEVHKVEVNQTTMGGAFGRKSK